jgi:hypothetical protein
MAADGEAEARFGHLLQPIRCVRVDRLIDAWGMGWVGAVAGCGAMVVCFGVVCVCGAVERRAVERRAVVVVWWWWWCC